MIAIARRVARHAATRPSASSEATPPAAGRIAGAAAILLGGFVASRLVGVLRDVIISARFGTSGELDVYYAAFRIPDAIFTLVAGGALGSSLIPVFAESLATRRPGAVERLASAVFNIIAMAATAAALAGIVLAPRLAPALFAGFDEPHRARLVILVRLMLLQPIFFGMGEVITRYLNVRQHFFYPALAPVVYNLFIIGGALFLAPSLGTLGLALGVVSGALAYFLIQLPRAVSFGFRWQPVLDLGDAGLREVARLMLPRLLSQGAVQLAFIITARLASFLPPGRYTALNYAWVIMMLPLGTFAMSLANAAFPTLAEQDARGDRAGFATTTQRALSTILFLMVPSALGLATLGQPIVQTIYQHGHFTLESSVLTAQALAIYALGLPGHGTIEILTRAFFAQHDTRTPVAVGVGAMALNVGLALVLVGPLGHAGIALAMTASALAEALALAVLLHRRVPVLAAGLYRAVGRTIVAGAALAAITLPTLGALRLAGLPVAIQTAGACLAGGASFLGVASLLRSPDLDAMLAQVRARLGR